MLLAGCTSTVAGVAVMATQQDADSAVGPLLDTGRYPTTVGHPVGTAGSEAAGAVLEAQRMAEYVVGPWEVDAKLRRPNFLATRVAPDMQLLDEVLPQPIRDVASAHGVITTFATSRSSSDSRAPLALTNLVMRFPDPDAAVTAATEMGDKNRHVGDAPRSPIVIHNHPEAVASAHDYLGDRTVVDSFTAHGPYVLYQGAQSKKEGSGALPPFAAQLTEFALGLQQNRIDQFVSTDPAKLADMPLDPTGKMLARTLATSDGDAFLVDGVWQPRAWLHFEGDPIAAAARYVAAGVEVVVNRLTTVYQTNNPRGAAAMVDKLATNRGPWVKAINGVPNLPAARCSTRKGASVAPTLHEIAAHFRCVASADRYAFIAYSDSGKDAKQQIAAQYRILAGK
jgi:hypothetical protein